MKPILKIASFILLVVLLVHLSCKKEKSCENCRDANKPPISIAGPDRFIILPTDSISLDGSSSSDPDGIINEWLWTKISGPASSTIPNSSAAITNAKNLVTGVYQFELKVTDNGRLSANDTVQITVNSSPQPNRPPVANAGADQIIILPTNTVTLNGSSSSDPDNNISNYAWSRISGPSSFNITNANVVQPQVTNLVQGDYQFELKVTDVSGLSSRDTMRVNVNDQIQPNRPPASDAGADQTIILPSNTVNLDGSGSTDPDNNIIAYAWTKISGPSSFNIANVNDVQTQAINLVQGTYLFELKVTDVYGLISKDTMRVCVFGTLSGQEIIYNDIWGCNDLCRDGDVYWNSSQNECNPYIDTSVLLQVSIRLDTSFVWVDVHKFNSPLPPINQFYWQIDRGFLWVFAFEGRLIGKQVTIKVRFL